MNTKHRSAVAALFMIPALSAMAQTATAQAPQPAPACDRTCLNKFVDRYIDADGRPQAQRRPLRP